MNGRKQRTWAEVCKLAVRAQFDLTIRRVRGSHHYLVHTSDPSRRTTVAVHSGDLPPSKQSLLAMIS